MKTPSPRTKFYQRQNYTEKIFLLRVVILTLKDWAISGLIIAFSLERLLAEVL
jgi:hypothetical protein